MSEDIARIEAYLAALPAEQRAVLQHVRATIAEAAPAAIESFGYGIPASNWKARCSPMVRPRRIVPFMGRARRHRRNSPAG